MARTEQSFQKNRKEQQEQNVLFKRTDKNGKNRTFFLKERKSTARTECSFLKKKGKGQQEWNILFKRTEQNGMFFSKEEMPNPANK